MPATILLLSGFLGSGKTTLLGRILEYSKESGVKTAVIMNELGEANLDGALVDASVPMAELLSGCICCSIRGDLTLTIHELMEEQQPELIVIESTGAANPLEIIDGVTDVSLTSNVSLKHVITVVDTPLLLEMNQKRGSTFRLMKEQIRAASLLVVNKTDLLDADGVKAALGLIEEWNPKAERIVTSRADIDVKRLIGGREGDGQAELTGALWLSPDTEKSGKAQGHHDHEGHVHHTHQHVMVATAYLQEPLQKERFIAAVEALPHEVYRGKGVIRFVGEEDSQYLFQFGFRQMELTKIRPMRELKEVLVLIGEHMSAELLPGLIGRSS